MIQPELETRNNRFLSALFPSSLHRIFTHLQSVPRSSFLRLELSPASLSLPSIFVFAVLSVHFRFTLSSLFTFSHSSIGFSLWFRVFVTKGSQLQTSHFLRSEITGLSGSSPARPIKVRAVVHRGMCLPSDSERV